MTWIVGMDLHPHGTGALHFAGRLAARSGAPEHFVAMHVLEEEHLRAVLRLQHLDEVVDAAYADLQALLRREGFSHVVGDVQVVQDLYAADGLERACARLGADGIIVGRAAPRRSHRIVRLGRVTRQLLRRGCAPVVVVPPDLRGDDLGQGEIMALTELREESLPACRLAAELAGVRPFLGARLETPVGPHEPRLALWGPPLVLAAAGLLLGLAPQPASAVVGAAARAVLPGGGAVELAPWHAPGWPMALGVAGLLLGGAAWHWRLGLRRLDAAAGGGASWGPSRGYEPALGGLLRGAAIQTRSLQSGSLRRYLHVILLAALAVTAAALLAPGGWPDPLIRPEVRLHEAGLAALVVASAVVAVRSRSRLRAIAAMGVVGYGIALVFLLYGAPDLAMTQFVVETLTVVVFVSAFHRLPQYAALSTRAARLVDLAISGAFGALMAGLVLAASSVDLAERISPYFVENGVEKAHGRNIVNVILVDFRALDTLGEITVIAIAGFGVLALLGLRGGTEGRP
jgi:multisubunit Na+/H+ antiporter MnhB subunit/nucleotide-binding universal stress UspA family protein